MPVYWAEPAGSANDWFSGSETVVEPPQTKPASHSPVGYAMPRFSQYMPGGHSMHAATETRLVTLTNVPSGHACGAIGSAKPQ
eukprot:2491185-Rhodomonas_salina.4